MEHEAFVSSEMSAKFLKIRNAARIGQFNKPITFKDVV